MKQIKLTVKNCGECPYSEYDPHYSMNYQSGHDCNDTGIRIASDQGSTIVDLSTLPIPEWCKLKDADELMENRKLKLEQLKKNNKICT